jgi:hypothetical protein
VIGQYGLEKENHPPGCCATVSHAPIDLPEQALVMIASRARDVTTAAEQTRDRSAPP